MSKPISLGVCLTIFLVVLGADQLTKELAVQQLRFQVPYPVIPGFFSFTLTHNTGAAFGMFSGLSPDTRPYALLLSTVIALGVVFYLLRHESFQDSCSRIALFAVIGGAIGNIIDRFRYGYVIDFLDAYIGSYHWPAFNIADSAICVGVAILVLWPKKQAEVLTPAPKKGLS